MWTDTIGILVLCSIGAIIVLFVVRITFREAANPRDAVVSPPVFVICGGLMGISLGMLFLADREGRVTLERGIGSLAVGSILGVLLGAGARELYARLERGKAVVFLMVMVLLGASIGAPFGWIAGSITIGSPGNFDLGSEYESALKHSGRQGMMCGLAFGSGVGLLLAVSDLKFRRRGAT